MASTRYDLLSPRKNNRDDRTYFHKVGAMFENANRDGFNISLDSLPLPDASGEVRLIAKLPLERDGPRREGEPSTANTTPTSIQIYAANQSLKTDIDDEIPF